MYITPCGNLYSMYITYIATTLDVHPFATMRPRIYDYIYLMALAISGFMVGVHVCQSDECTLLSPMLMN